MDSARADLFAGARLAGDEHARIAARNDGELLNFGEEGRALANELFEAELLLELLHPRLLAARLLKRMPDAREDIHGAERRCDEVCDTLTERVEKLNRLVRALGDAE